ncbi:MAG: molybdopterin cofactor-binding domain-containing protein, partial [Chloroflexota bacterium]
IERIAAAMLEANPLDMEIAGGQVRVAGAPGRSVSLRQVAEVTYHPVGEVPAGEEPGLQVTSWYQPAGINDPPDAQGRLNNSITYSNAVHAAVVEVDPDTGGVQVLRYVVAHDCGTVINPLIVEGQIQGGVAQGFGGALYEDLLYDEGGQFQSGSFMDYLMPTAMEIPDVSTAHMDTPAPDVEGGFKGMGEGGLIGAPAAIANAVADALAPLGIEIDRTPISPGYLFVMLNAVKHPPPQGADSSLRWE